MNTFRDYIATKKQNGQKILSIYLPAGFPNPNATLPLLESIAEAGADLIELGVPFSDPLADGPTIQAASQIALQNGITLEKTVEILAQFKQKYDVPVLLMGYANPFMKFGWEKLFTAAKKAGAAGFIIPDLPPEESGAIQAKLRASLLDLIYLVTPNTPPERLRLVNSLSQSFIYAVSVTGVTGARKNLPESTQEYLQHLSEISDHPILAGFGISNPESAKTISQFCDGVIIGSAVIKCITETAELESNQKAVYEFVNGIKAVLGGGKP